MISRGLAFINDLDFLNLFGYNPQFTIKREECYKSEIGAVVYLGYSILFWYYMISEAVSYFQKINEVDSVKIYSSDSQNYNLTSNDLYFGIGLFTNVTENISDYTGLEFGLEYNLVDENGKKQKTIFNLVPCIASVFYAPIEWNNLISDRQAFLNSTIGMYLCPETDKIFNLIPFGFLRDSSYLNLYIKAINASVLNSSLNFLNLRRPKINIIWSDTAISNGEKYSPYKSYINYIQSSFHTTSFEEIDLYFQASSLSDDPSAFSYGYTPYIDEVVSSQPNGQVFTVNRIEYHTVDQFSRTPLSFNDDYLYFTKIKLNLAKEELLTLRDYKKFIDFLAGATALTKNVLFLLILIMDNVNSTRAKHIMMKTCFSSDTIKNMGEFEKRFKTILIQKDNQKKSGGNVTYI